ncbi:MAG: patatin-like phospholipase family protein [Longicatena sp.]
MFILKKKDLKIGLALSGGGMRAAIFHLGVLKYLAQEKLLSKISHISSVSGASIGIGLVYSCNGNTWPSDTTFICDVLPKVTNFIVKQDIQWTSLLKLLISPYYWDKKVNLLGNVMEQKWKVHGCLQDIPSYPLWTINTTAYESGKDFRISAKSMGEMHSNYVMRPNFRLSHAMAASASFPVLIGPYKLKTRKYTWYDETHTIVVIPRDKILHLWDGGVYDNMGLDPLFSMENEKGLEPEINYLIVSNASGNIEHKTRQFSFSIENLKRLLDINMDQVASLKSSSVKTVFKKYHNGVYIKIGEERATILEKCSIEESKRIRSIHKAMKFHDVDFVANYKTTLERIKQKDFDRILQHGYECATSIIACYGYLQ